jgi:hypothetical protein
MQINARDVGSVKAFERVMNDIIEQRQDTVIVFLQRRYRTHFVFIEPVWPNKQPRKGT